MPLSRTLPRPARVALYCRVSTTDQRADLQLDALRQLSAQRRWSVVDEFVDLGVSGAKDRRPGLDEMMRRVRLGKVNVVACWKLDRLPRSLRHLIHMVDEFRASNVDLVSMSDSIDTSSPSGRFALHVLGACSELERELGRERTIQGLASARRRGVRLGRRPVRVDLERARELRGAGMSYRKLAIELGVSVGVAHRLLSPAEGGVHQSSPDLGARVA